MFRQHHTLPDDALRTDRETVTTRFDPTSERSPSMDVVESVAAVLGVRPTTLAPLQETVDTDALDRLVDTNGDQPDGPGTPVVSFRYEGVPVTITANGLIVVTPPQRDRQ